MNEPKVRLNQLDHTSYRCWVDTGMYYYGRSLSPDQIDNNKQILQKTFKIEQWLDRSDINYRIEKIDGCLPEWRIDFNNPKDVTMFTMKWVS